MECYQCKRNISTVFKCPIKLIPKSIEVVTESLCGSRHVFTQHVVDEEIEDYMKVLPSQVEYYEEFSFCSWDCCKDYAELNYRDYRFAQCVPIIEYLKSNN